MSVKEPNIYLRGSPVGLVGLVALDRFPWCGDGASLELSHAGREYTATVHALRLGPHVAQLSATLDSDIPPGEHRGVMATDEQRATAEVIVEPYRAVLASPGSFSLEVAPGATTSLRFSLYNQGNVPLEVAKAHGFGIFRDNGVEDSLASAYRRTDVEGLDRVAALADELVKHHAFVRLVIKSGGFTLAPNELRDVVADVKWPDNLQADDVYAGTWPLGELAMQFVVKGLEAPKKKKTSTRKK